MYETEKHLKKKGKQAGLFRLSAVAAALVMALPCYASPLSVSNGTQNENNVNINYDGKWGVTVWNTSLDNRAILNLGEKGVTKNITVDAVDTSGTDAYAIGITAGAQGEANKKLGGLININTENLNVNVTSDGAALGIHAGTNYDRDDLEENARSKIVINADNTVINVEGKNAVGIAAYSKGIIEINGNLEVNADNVIEARGNSTVDINKNGDGKVILNGNINFGTPGPEHNSGNIIDAGVNINLTTADSSWTGNVLREYPVDNEGKADYTEVNRGITLNLSNGAQWNPTVIENSEGPAIVNEQALNKLDLNAGIINIKTAGQEVKVDNLSGTGGTINAAAQKKEDGKLTSAKLQAGQVDSTAGTPHLAVNYQGINADDLGADTASAITQLASNIQAQGATQTQTVAEGDVAGAVVAQVNEDGNVSAVTESANSVMGSLHQIAQNNFLVFRSQMNDMDKRMGDLRTMPQASGMWARAIAGQSEYKSMHNTYQTLQIGADHRIGNFLIGATASYTDGDGSLKNGSSDDKNYNFGLYGSWLGDDGQFVDVTLKRHHTQSDYDLYYTRGEKVDGSMHTSGTSLSVEYGRRFNIANTNYYLEPQAELMYGHLDSTDYTTSNGVRISQDAIKSLVGRLGIAAGWVSPEKTGSAYIKASVLNDWEAESDIRASKDGISRKYSEDMGGTWGEFALGGTWNINKNFAAYGEVETTAGNPVRTTYQVSGGIRYSF